MNKALSFVLLLATVGIASWFLLRDGDLAPVAPTPAPGASGAASVADPAASKAAAERAAGITGSRDPDRSAVASAVAGGTTAAPAIVRGRLVDSGRAGRAGVGLRLSSWAVPEDGIDMLPPPPPSTRRDDRAEATTKTDGSFELQLGRARQGELDLVGDSLVFVAGAPVVDGRKGDQDLGDIVVVRGGAVRGVVRDAQARPVPDVRVGATEGLLGFGAFSTTTTDASGAFTVGRLRPGTWTLRTASGSFLPATVDVTLKAEEIREGVVLVVEHGQAIAGQVVDDLGRPVAGCKVGSKRREARGGMDIERFAADEATKTDANGYFTLSGLSGGSVTVRAFGSGHASAIARDVPVGTGNLVLRVERLAEVRGVLLAADGSPIEGSLVRATSAQGGPGGPEFQGIEALDFAERPSAKTAVDGTFRIAGVKPGVTNLVAEGKAHRPARRDGLAVEPGHVVEGVRLLADAGATARVTVVDPAGAPVVGASVRIERPRADSPSGSFGVARRVREVEAEAGPEVEAEARFVGDDAPLGVATTDAQGIAVVPGLPEGAAAVHARHGDHAAAVPVDIALPRAGTLEVKAMLRVPGFAEVRVVTVAGEPASGAAVTVRPADGGNDEQGTTDAQGKARFGPLAPGAYVAFLRRGDRGLRHADMFVVLGGGSEGLEGTRADCTVTAGETTLVRIVHPVLTRLHGVVTGIDGPVPACTIELDRNGDGPRLPGLAQRSATTADDGSFSFDGLESGHYTAHFGKEHQLVKSTASFDIPANTPELRRDLSLRTGRFRVQVCAKDGERPIEGATVELEPARDPGSSPEDPPQRHAVMMVSISTNADEGGDASSTSMTMGMPRARTGANGVAEIEDVPVGAYTVRIEHGGHAPATRKDQMVVERQLTDCGRVALERSGVIRGKVLAADGTPAQVAFVECRAVDSQDWGQPEIAEGGSFRFASRRVGRHFLRAREIRPGGGGAAGPEVEVTVAANETVTAEVRLPAK